LRLMRLTRLARLMRSFPALVILIRGMVQATRSVLTTLVLLVLLLVVFAVIFTSQLKTAHCDWCETDDWAGLCTDEMLADPTMAATNPLEEQFGSMARSMFTLFFSATLLDEMMAISYPLWECPASKHLIWVFLLFVVVSSFTVLNMLIGVLCDVVSTVEKQERETMVVNTARERLVGVFKQIDKDGSQNISRDEFEKMGRYEECQEAFRQLQIEPKHLLALADSLFEEDGDEGVPDASHGQDMFNSYVAGASRQQKNKNLSFEEFLDVVCHMRPGTAATVLDIADLRNYCRKPTRRLEEIVAEAVGHLVDFTKPGGSKRAAARMGVSGEIKIEPLTDNLRGKPGSKPPAKTSNFSQAAEEAFSSLSLKAFSHFVDARIGLVVQKCDEVAQVLEVGVGGQ